ncbi:hypothetical protein [Nocardioides sp. GY 10127]|nr:hypothetical protein [Nocardioides sp. GY 10127]
MSASTLMIVNPGEHLVTVAMISMWAIFAFVVIKLAVFDNLRRVWRR